MSASLHSTRSASLRWVVGASSMFLLCVLPAKWGAAGDEEPAPAGPSAPSAPGAAAPDDSEDPDPTPPSLDEKTKVAVAKGVAWLRSRQHDDGSWGALAKGDENTYNGKGHAYTTPYGPTALALYTLMKCGVPNDDPQVKKGFVFLRKSKTAGTCYEISMKILAATATADPFKQAKEAAADKVRLSGEMKAWTSELIAALAKLRAPNGWRYWGPKDENKGGPQDLSSTQMACLALFAAERCGVKSDPALWTGIINYALQQQDTQGPERPRAVFPRPPKAQPKPAGGAAAPEGTTAGPAPAAPGAPNPNAKDWSRGFSYIKGAKGMPPFESSPTGSMSACGIGCLMMARFTLMTRYPKAWATQDAAKVQQSVYDGLAWLDANWSPYENAGGWNYYYEYCVERAMDLIGSWKIGPHYWYTEMAEQIVGRQKDKGNWEGANSREMNGDVLDTCFALLFLRRATKGGIPFPSVTGGSDTPAADTR
jgi:Squalene-hopene cyclase C-terminal domain